MTFKWGSKICVAFFLIANLHANAFSQEINKQAKASATSGSRQQTGLDRLAAMKIMLKIDGKNFEESIEIIKSKTDMNFLIDDTAPTKLFTYFGNTDVKSALDKLCEFFDYSWKIGKNREIQMLRSFTGELDAPQANLPELEKISSELVDLFASIGCYPGRKTTSPYMTKKFYKSLDSSQIERLKRGEVLLATDLQPAQFDLLKGALSSYVFGGMTNQFGAFHNIIASMKHTNLQMLSIKDGSKKLFLNLSPQIDEENSFLMRIFYPEKLGKSVLVNPIN